MIKINNKLKGRCQRQKHFRLGVVGGEREREEKEDYHSSILKWFQKR